jgi:hypothetical protein
MSGELVPIIIVPAIFFSIVAMIKIVSDSAVRRKLIEKGMVNADAQYLFASGVNGAPSSLKWGMVLIAVGGAILVGQLAPYSISEEVTISAMLIMAGLALIVYYFIAGRMTKKSE